MKINVIPADRLTPDHIFAWSNLQRADAAVDKPFFRPEFISAVAAVRDDIEVAVLKENGEYVGFFPFQRDRRNIGRAVSWRMSDMHGIVAGKGVDWNAEELIREAGLLAWHFDHLVASQKPFQPYHYSVEESPYIDLREGYEVYRKERRQAGSSLIMQAFRKSRKIAREIGPLRFEMHTKDTKTFASLLTWKQAQINRKYYVDVFRFKWVIDLLEMIWRTETEGFSGVLSALYAGNQLIAVHLGMRSYDILSSWIPTFDSTYAKYSPGLILHIELAKKAAEMGIKRIDLGRGYNQMKTSLMSGTILVATGSVELRPLNRVLRAGWYGARDLVHSTPLGGIPLRIYRRMRNWMIHNQQLMLRRR